MGAKSANLYARIEPDVKEEAEAILSAVGLSASAAINLFYKQIILQRGLPFAVKVPDRQPAVFSALSREELDAELEKGYQDVEQGRTVPAAQAFAEIHEKYGL